ncbi:uncharacterized protein LOC130535264 isoform X1 [Takifugu flavidus]|uniref:uncharacterized protein LOC130535264 isoform X1 n=2 Tax=Takifugu flavidus TaxID=433684 RepID=UPI0025446DE7|nr:uncharacterized protein LOC130535264 isoform X1 [Takifugu flavidus]
MHSDFVSLRNSMFHLNQAALLFILQLFMWKVFAGVIPPEQRNLTVVRGETVTLNCNVTMENIKQTEWFKDKLIFAFQYSTKRNVSSLPPDRLQMNIDTNSQSTLKLLNAQPGDAGYYNCSVIGLTGIRRIVWNLLVSEGPEGEEGSSNPVGNFLYLLVCVPALLVCVLALTVCLWRKRVLSKNPVEDQFEPGSGGEVTTEPQMRTTSWPENRKRSRYVERLNSIYGL